MLANSISSANSPRTSLGAKAGTWRTAGRCRTRARVAVNSALVTGLGAGAFTGPPGLFGVGGGVCPRAVGVVGGRGGQVGPGDFVQGDPAQPLAARPEPAAQAEPER